MSAHSITNTSRHIIVPPWHIISYHVLAWLPTEGGIWACNQRQQQQNRVFADSRASAWAQRETLSFFEFMNEMRSSGEVILPKMSFRLGTTAEMKRNAFFLTMYEGNAFHFGLAWASGADGAGRNCRFKDVPLGATAANKDTRLLFVIL